MQYLMPLYRFAKPVFWGAFAGEVYLPKYSELNQKILAVALAAFAFDAYPLSLERRALFGAGYMTLLAFCDNKQETSFRAHKFLEIQPTCFLAFNLLSVAYQFYSGWRIQPLAQLATIVWNA